MQNNQNNSARTKWFEALDRYIQGFGQWTNYLCALLMVAIIA